MRYFFGPQSAAPCHYDLVVNTARVTLELVATLVVALVRGELELMPVSGALVAATHGRVLTLARELGAGDTGFAPTLAERLRLRVYDRALLENEAARLGMGESDVEKIDESPAGTFDWFRPGSSHRRYFQVVGQLMTELSARGDVVIVGRGGNRFLSDHPRVFHVRLMASLPVRVRRVMEFRWVAEAAARKLISEHDERRRRFHTDYFGADWCDPLGYCVTVNTGRLGPTAVDLVAAAAESFWKSRDRD
jgi:cytidylate kinase